MQLQCVKIVPAAHIIQKGVLLAWHCPQRQQVPDVTPASMPSQSTPPSLLPACSVQRSKAPTLRWVKELTHGNLEARDGPRVCLPR